MLALHIRWRCHISRIGTSLFRISRKATWNDDQLSGRKGHLDVDVPFASQSDDSPVIPIFVRLLFNLRRERNSAHNSVSKLFIQYSLVCVSKVLYNFIEAVDQWLFRRHVHDLTTERVACQLLAELGLVHTQDVGELLSIFGCRLGLTVEDGSDSYLVAAKLFCYVFKCEVLGCFGFE